VPDEADHVCIKPSTAVVEVSEEAGSVSSLQSEGKLVIVSGVLRLMDPEEDSTVSSLVQSGGQLGGPSTLLVKASFEWSGGEQVGEATTEIAAGARLSIKSGAPRLEAGRTLRIAPEGKAAIGVDGDLAVGEESLVENAGTFEVDGNGEDGARIEGGGVETGFRNFGIFTRLGIGDPVSVDVPFDNEGTVDVSGGALQLEDGGSEEAPAVFKASGTGGLLSFAGGTFTLEGGLSFTGPVAQTGGKLRGPLTVKGSFEWSGGEQLEGLTEIAPGGKLSIKSAEARLGVERRLKVDLEASAVMAAGADLIVGGGVAVENAGTFELAGGGEDGARIEGGGSETGFRNFGTVTRSGVGDPVSVDVPFDNEGTVNASGGVLQLEDGGSEEAAAVFSASGGEGLVSFAGGTFTFAKGLTLDGRVAQTGGKLKGPLLVNGSFEWSGGEQVEGAVTEVVASGKLSIGPGGGTLGSGRMLKVDLEGSAVMVAGADLVVGENASVRNAGSFEVEGGEEDGTRISYGGNGSAFRNSGTFKRSGGGGALPVDIAFDNEGTADVSGGALQLEDGGSEEPAAVFSASGGEGLVSFAGGTFTFASGLTLDGRVAQTGGKLKGPLLVRGSFEWSGGEQVEGAATEVMSSGRLSIGEGAETLGAGRVLKVDVGAAAVMAVGADLVVGENSSVRNAGSFEVEGGEEDGTRISYGGNGSAFRNSGTFNRSSGGGALPVDIAFDNEGTVDVSGGALQLEDGGSEEATAVFSASGAGGVLTLAEGTFTLANGLSLNGPIAQAGGLLKGTLLVDGSFEWSGGEQDEGITEVVSGGTLALKSGGETLGAGRVLKVDAGAAAAMGAGADLVVGENASVRNAGSFEVEGGEEDGTRISYGGNGSAFRNAGIFKRSGYGGALPVGIAFENEGTVDVSGGILTAISYVQAAHGLLSLHIGGALLGTGFSQLNIEGPVTLEGSLRVTTENGFHPEPGQRFQVLSATTLTGRFASVEEVGSIGGGWSYTTEYGTTGIELVVAGGPVPTSTTASLTGGGQAGTAISVPEGTAVTASASLGGANASTASGTISYRVYTNASCSDEVANAGTVTVGAGGTVAGSSQEVFAAGTYYWQASYSGDSTNQRSSTPCGGDVETVQPPLEKVGKKAVLSSIEELPPPVSGRTANLLAVSGVVQVQLPGKRSFERLTGARSVPEGTLVNTSQGLVTLCRASPESTKQCAEFNGGEFRIEEKKNAPSTELALTGGHFSGCPASRPGVASASRGGASKPVRKLWGSGHGHFTTDGRNSSTTVRGTIWSVEDRCASTVTKVIRGVVSVYDYRLHRSFQLSTGHSYVALAR
jgi:hypothetical protein